MFNDSPIASATLHVLEGSIDLYKKTSPWSGFGNIVALAISLADVEVNETNFPDENFRNWVYEQEYGADSLLTKEEILGITSIDINNRGIRNLKGIEYFATLIELNLCHNAVTGDIAEVFRQLTDEGKTSPVVTLNISDNQLTGNVSAIGQVCTELRQLYASHNRLETCLPKLNDDISFVDLGYQTLNWTWDFTLNADQDNMQMLPGILRYDHQQADGVATRQDFTCALGDWSMSVVYDNGTLTINAPAGKVYREANGARMDVTLATSAATGSTFKMLFNFMDGDANFSGETDIYDLETILNYMFNDWQHSAFNFTASNLYNDEVINVQDVVLVVEKLLSDVEPNNKRRYGRTRTRGEEAPDAADAYLYWRGNELILNTSVGVAAADICLTGDASITWDLKQMGFTVTEKKDATGTHAVIYSLSSAETPVGETVIAHRDGDNAEPVSALLADRYAAPISVCLTASEATAVGQLMAVTGDWSIFRTDGSIVAKGSGKTQLMSARNRLAAGIYILHGEHNNTQKFTIK